MNTWFKVVYATGEMVEIYVDALNDYTVVKYDDAGGLPSYLPRACRAFSIWPTRAEAEADMLRHWMDREAECAHGLAKASAMLAKLKPVEVKP